MGLTSILGKAGLVTKTYFPREISVLSSNITAFIMMIFEFGAFVIFLVAFQFVPSITILLLPIILVSLFIYTLGISFGLSVLGIRFKDLHSIWTVLLQATFFMTPIIFTLDIYPEQVKQIISLNPLVTILTMAQDVTLYGKIPPLIDFVRIYVTSFAFLLVGYLIFKRLNNKIIEEL